MLIELIQKTFQIWKVEIHKIYYSKKNLFKYGQEENCLYLTLKNHKDEKI